jgi:Protein of unknown function (DUF1353)
MMRALLTAAILLALCTGEMKGQTFGSFEGEIVVKWDDNDGRTMILVQPFAYIAPNGIRWDAPPGSRVDGASIPQFAWSIIGGPFEGKYRKASIVHDVACVARTQPWQSVHEAFYTAMLASGVDSIKAKIMYAAVYHFGPRWVRQIVETSVPIRTAKERAQAIAAAAQPDETTRLQVEPMPNMPLTTVTGGEVNTPPPDRANISVLFEPRSSALSSADFEALKATIERDDLPLSQIRGFKHVEVN